jgi:hypothetical protein
VYVEAGDLIMIGEEDFEYSSHQNPYMAQAMLKMMDEDQQQQGN